MKPTLLTLVPFLLSAVGCAALDKFPLPDTFDAAFATGEVCMPSNIAAASEASTFPVRFNLCRYRCITLDRSTATVNYGVLCPQPGFCAMALLATATAHTNPAEPDCDARDLVNPPPGQCTNETFDFNMIGVPWNKAANAALSGTFQVNIPYLELEQGQRVADRLKALEPPSVVLQEEVGTMTYPERQFNITVSTTGTPVATADDLAPTDCHPITAP